jgi:aspartate/methionine/tyrosine aminotransferase
MKTYAADRLHNLQESVIRSITRYAFDKGAILLAQGFPDFDPPEEVIAAAENAMRSGRNQYGMTWGQPSLRKAIPQKSRRFYGQEVDPDRHVTVTCGVTEAVIAALLGVVNPGDKVVVLEPAHENYHAGITFAGGIPIWVPLRPPEYQFDPDELARAFEQNPKAVLFNSPRNPSGRVFTEQELSIIRDLCVTHDVVAITDEIYEHLVFDGLRHSWLIDEVGVATVPSSSFYASSPALGRGLVRFAFPKKDETLDAVEERFEKLPAGR